MKKTLLAIALAIATMPLALPIHALASSSAPQAKKHMSKSYRAKKHTHTTSAPAAPIR